MLLKLSEWALPEHLLLMHSIQKKSLIELTIQWYFKREETSICVLGFSKHRYLEGDTGNSASCLSNYIVSKGWFHPSRIYINLVLYYVCMECLKNSAGINCFGLSFKMMSSVSYFSLSDNRNFAYSFSLSLSTFSFSWMFFSSN